jgi:hypothetical protein
MSDEKQNQQGEPDVPATDYLGRSGNELLAAEEV